MENPIQTTLKEEKETLFICLRAKAFTENPDAVVVYLGCGLDTRIKRINPPDTVNWYDVDFPEVIELRKNFFTKTANYQMISSSVTDAGWMEEIPSDRPAMIVAEGVLMYLAPEEVEKLFHRLMIHFSHGQMVFDVLSI